MAELIAEVVDVVLYLEQGARVSGLFRVLGHFDGAYEMEDLEGT